MDEALAGAFAGHPDLDPNADVMAIGLRRAAAQIHLPGDGEEVEVGDPPDGWREWNGTLFPSYVRFPYAAWQAQAHEWADAIRAPSSVVRPFVAIAARGGGKSSTAELIATRLGLTGRRRYVWYVRETQDQADDSVANIAGMLESAAVERYYPEHASRKLSKYGHSKGWNSQRLRTAGEFTVDAIGLDTAARGLKIDEVRPDLIVLDDIDGKHDGEAATKKKLETLTHTILPAGSPAATVLAIQNLIIPHGIFTSMATDKADYLVRRIVVGPHPAVRGMKTETRKDPETGRLRAYITAGTATWEGQNVAACQALMDTIGLRAFLQECQHEVHERPGALWARDDIVHVQRVPGLKRVGIGVDPSGGGDDIGIVVAGETDHGTYVVLYDGTLAGALGPLAWGQRVVELFSTWGADFVLAEKNFGGNLVQSNIEVAARDRETGNKQYVPVELISASRGKDVRAEPVAALYRQGMVEHVGEHQALEQEMTTWVKGDSWSPNRMDALVWVLTKLANIAGATGSGGYKGQVIKAKGNGRPRRARAGA